MKYSLVFILSLLLAPMSLAKESRTSRPLFIAQVTGCPRAEVLYFYETRNFTVNICQGLNNYIFYRGVSKSEGSSINLETAKDSKGAWIARNGKIVYKVNYTELIVTDNGKVILKERVISPP